MKVTPFEKACQSLESWSFSNDLCAIKKSKCHLEALEMKICMNLLAWSQQQ